MSVKKAEGNMWNKLAGSESCFSEFTGGGWWKLKAEDVDGRSGCRRLLELSSGGGVSGQRRGPEMKIQEAC